MTAKVHEEETAENDEPSMPDETSQSAESGCTYVIKPKTRNVKIQHRHPVRSKGTVILSYSIKTVNPMTPVEFLDLTLYIIFKISLC